MMHNKLPPLVCSRPTLGRMNSDKIMIGLQHVMARDSNHEFQFADGAGSLVKV